VGTGEQKARKKRSQGKEDLTLVRSLSSDGIFSKAERRIPKSLNEIGNSASII